MTAVTVLMVMIFFHIVDDFYLQGILASLKQKEWWKKNAPDALYRYDYIVALLMHSFSWTFLITLPLFLYLNIWNPLMFVCNMINHMIVDNEKANRKSINLCFDQSIHLFQIIGTWLTAIY